MTDARQQDEMRKAAQAVLEDAGDGIWLATASEIDAGRGQVFFWLQISGKEDLVRAVPCACSVLAEFAASNPEREFNLSLIELSETEEIVWEDLEDEEIRHGVARQLGEYPDHKARKEFSVFDRRI